MRERELAALRREAVFASLWKRPGATRTELARWLRLRPTSVGEIVRSFLADGLAVERPARSLGAAGRPRAPLAARPERLVAISVSVESRLLRATLVDLGERVLAESERPLSQNADSGAILRALVALVSGLERRRPHGSILAGAGLSLVGTVSARDLAWVSAARWPRLRRLPLAPIARRIGAPLLVRRSNDVALELYLEPRPPWPLAPRQPPLGNTTVFVHWGFGVGAAVAHRGVILDSTIGRFGEVGHLPARGLRQGGERCLCGSRGCLETEAALWALLPRMRRRLGALPENERLLAAALAKPSVARLPEVRRAVRAISEALLMLHRIFYPDELVLAGPLAANQEVFRELGDGLAEGLPEYARGAVTLSALPDGLAACRTGSARPLLQDSLHALLRRTT